MGYCHLDSTGSWAVNGTPIYVPDVSTSLLHSSLVSDSSGRTEDGVMHIEWVRTDILKKELKYSVMTGTELAYMVNLMQGRVFEFTFICDDNVKTITGYTSEINATLYSKLGSDTVYRDVSINVIEM